MGGGAAASERASAALHGGAAAALFALRQRGSVHARVLEVVNSMKSVNVYAFDF